MTTFRMLRLCLILLCWGGVATAQTISLEADEAVETTSTDAASTQSQTSSEAETAAQASNAPAAAAGGTAAVAPAPRKKRRAVPASFVLRDLRIQGGSNYLPAADIAAFEKDLEGRRFLNTAVGEIAGAFRQLYLSEGVTTAYAQVAGFNPRAGVLTLKLTEQSLGKVRLGKGILSERYLAYRLNLKPGSLADDREINARLERLQLTDGVALDVRFAGTDAPNVIDLAINQPEIERHSSFVTLDNYGSAAQGKEQLTLGHTIRSITGWNDPLSVFVTLREGSVAGTLSYQRVISRQGAQMGFVLSRSDTESLSTTPVEGYLDTATLSLSMPLVVESQRQLTFSAALRKFREEADFAGTRILDQKGEDLVLGMNGFQRGENWSLSGGAQYIIGRFSSAGGPNQNYQVAAVNLTYSRTLGADIFGSITFAGQRVTSGIAPASRHFTVTSPSGVRGYPTSLTSDGDGYYVRLQVEKSTPYRFGNGDFGLRPFVFFDIGENFDTASNGLGVAKSVGLGASFFRKDTLFGDIYIAKPLNGNVAGFSGSKDIQLRASMTFKF